MLALAFHAEKRSERQRFVTGFCDDNMTAHLHLDCEKPASPTCIIFYICHCTFCFKSQWMTFSQLNLTVLSSARSGHMTQFCVQASSGPIQDSISVIQERPETPFRGLAAQCREHEKTSSSSLFFIIDCFSNLNITLSRLSPVRIWF